MNLKSKFIAGLNRSPQLKGALKHCCFVLLFFTLLFFAFFSPVLFSGDHLLAPGDGLNYHVAAFYSPRVFWDTMLLGGTPLYADSQIMMWYPPQMVLCLIPGAWNFFVVSAYVMASCFAYGYSYAVTGSRLGAIVSGTIYGMSGFMMAHLGHTTIIHSAAWMPLIVWSLEMLRRKLSAGWFALACFAVTCSLLAGHSQIFFYSLALAGAYVLIIGWRAPVGRWRYYLLAALVVVLGLGLAAIQLVPTAELARLSVRAELRFIDFVTFSIPRRQLLMLVYPVLFGGVPSWGPTAYFGEWNITELAGYVGLLPLMLAAVGLFAFGRRRLAIFWLAVGTIALLLALGEVTPLARIVYRLPLLGLFRAQARHVVELALAVSVLAGIGVSSLERREASRRTVLIVVTGGALLMLLSFIIIRLRLEMYAGWKGVTGLRLQPWANPTIGVPVLVFLAAAAAFLFWATRPKSVAATLILLAVLVIDLGTFGWTYEWHFRPPNTNLLASPLFAESYKATLLKEHQRLFPALGALGPPTDVPPNLSRMWGIPSASGYGPLTLLRPSQLMTMGAAGSLGAPWRNTSDQGLNLMAVRYLFFSQRDQTAAAPAPTTNVQGVVWSTEDINLWLGVGCVPEALPHSLKLKLPKPAAATAVAVVSKLGCSTGIADGAEVARLLVTDREGAVHTSSLLAGRDSAEWLADCADVKPLMHHKRAQVFNSFHMEREKPCDGHNYLSRFSLDGSREVSSVEIQWVGPGGLSIDKISLVNEQTGDSMPLVSALIEGGAWHHTEDIFNTSVYENERAMPRAWLATEVAQLRPEEALSTIKTSKLPEGKTFDPAQTALVEESFEAAKQTAAAATAATATAPAAAAVARSAEVLSLKDSVMEVRTTSPTPAFLVTSDVLYPGWGATVDGAPVQLFQADYALRGVWVPAGTHLVRFTYRPRSFYYGAGLSALSLLALACAVFLFRRYGNGAKAGSIHFR